MSRQSVAVTGVGILSPLGIGRERVAEALASGNFEPGEVTLFDTSVYSRCTASQVPEFDVKSLVETPKTYLDRCSALTLAACYLAVRDAALAWRDMPAERRGLSHGTAFGCLDSLLAVTERIRKQGTRAASPMIFSHAFANSPASLVAIEYSVRGPAATFCMGRVSGAEAMEYGLSRVAADDVEFCLAGGSEALSEVLYAALDDGGELASGMVPAEGAAMFVLEACERAEGRGRKPLAVLEASAVAGSGQEAMRAAGIRADMVWRPAVEWGDAFGAQFPLLLAAAVVARDLRNGDRVGVVCESRDGAGAAVLEVVR
jgi:3-oxoacyl-[acyl-carrier-protein] synthase II